MQEVNFLMYGENIYKNHSNPYIQGTTVPCEQLNLRHVKTPDDLTEHFYVVVQHNISDYISVDNTL